MDEIFGLMFHLSNAYSPQRLSSITLIRFGKFEEITVLMEKHVTLTQTQVISTQWKKTQKIIKGQIFLKCQI
jgi:hypothetical protein